MGLQGDNWYSYYYPEGYYEGAYYDGTATGRPKARKAKPRKPKGAVTGQVRNRCVMNAEKFRSPARSPWSKAGSLAQRRSRRMCLSIT